MSAKDHNFGLPFRPDAMTSRVHGFGASASFWSDFRKYLNRRRCRIDRVANLFVLVACLHVLFRWHESMSPQGVLSMWAYIGLELLCTVWKVAKPGSYLEWREALAAAALAASTAIDGMWEATTLGLNSDASLPAWSGSSLRNHAALLLMALRATGCNSVLFLSLGRPIRLWLHVPTSALALALVLHRVPAVCATAALQDPIAAGIIDQWHSSLSGLAQLNPVGAGHSAAASKCQLVLSTMQWVFVFVLPSLAVAALESSALHHFKSDLARRWSRCVSGSGGGAVGKASPHLPGQMDRKESVVASWAQPGGAGLLPAIPEAACSREGSGSGCSAFSGGCSAEGATEGAVALPPVLVELQRRMLGGQGGEGSEQGSRGAAQGAKPDWPPFADDLAGRAEQLQQARDLADSLWVVNRELQRDLDTAKSQLPQMELAHVQLKDAFFRLQTRLVVAHREAARLRDLMAGCMCSRWE